MDKKSKIIEAVHAVFGKELPERHVYGATEAKPTPTYRIIKEFKRWSLFVEAYNEYVAKQVKQPAKSVEPKKATTKNAEVVVEEPTEDED